MTDDDIAETISHVHRCLRPNGLFVLTIDLFLNLHPFCSRQLNEWGKNQNILHFTKIAKWDIVKGNPKELFGFSEFDSDYILSNLERYLIGRYPAMAQCLVLRKN
jgi:hypothetical protein